MKYIRELNDEGCKTYINDYNTDKGYTESELLYLCKLWEVVDDDGTEYVLWDSDTDDYEFPYNIELTEKDLKWAEEERERQNVDE